MQGKKLIRVLTISLLLALPAAGGEGYRPDYDFPGMGDDWYGRSMPDTRRDFPANPLDESSAGDDFGRGYNPAVARPGSATPLERTNGPGSAYAFFNDVIPAGGPIDCDNNGIDDACDLDCGPMGGACDVAGCGTASDCNSDTIPDVCQLADDDCDSNGVLDTCQLAVASGSCAFPVTLIVNDTTGPDSAFLGPPDDIHYGIGGQIVAWRVECGALVDGPGPDLTLYELDSSSPEFSAGLNVEASLDGVTWFSLKASEAPPVAIPGDDAHTNGRFARSYDLGVAGLAAARFVRVDGSGTGNSGTNTGFDLDAIGFIHLVTDDCDTSGVLDVCEIAGPADDCNGNMILETCELAAGSIADCDMNAMPDSCDTLGGAGDCDADGVPDVCEPDCNANAVADDCDIAAMTSADCNVNAVPDECDLALTTVTIEAGGGTSAPLLVFTEDFELPDTANFITYNMGQSIVTASTTWLVTTTGVDLYEAAARAEAAAYDGAQAIDLTGSPGAGVIETTIPTTAGRAHELVFHYARNDLLGADTGDAQVEVAGVTPLLQATIQHDPASHSFDEYLEFRGVFVADGATATLRFTSLDPGNTGITLDGIALYEFAPVGSGLPIGSVFDGPFAHPSPFPAASDVSAAVTASSDLGAASEYIDLNLNTIPLARFFDTDGVQCVEASSGRTIPAGTYNDAIALGGGSFDLDTSSGVNAFECADSYASVRLSYTPIVDCNTNGALDQCEIAAMTSTDLNLNAIADDCELDCNGNLQPDDYDIAQGTSLDCNLNGVPDECDIASATSNDCNTNGIPDECDTDCNANGVPDDCDISGATSQDCDANAIPDECDLMFGSVGCSFPRLLAVNDTTGPDDRFLGAPDNTWYGLGGQAVVLEFDCGFIVDGPGLDFTIYEAGGAEFQLLEEISVSADGIAFVSVQSTESPAVSIPGDGAANLSSARSYDIFATGLNAVRFVRIDGAGSGSSGPSTGFDLDAIGAVHAGGLDCDSTGTLDRCESFNDCNVNEMPDACEIALGLTGDCDTNGAPDSCDIDGGAPDVDADWIIDTCEPDCNVNAVPDHYDIEQGTSSDCNDNTVPDECDLSGGGSLDCNSDMIPDECPLCPTVEVVFIMDTSSSMTGEGAALCASVQQIVTELQADLVSVDTEILGILATPGGSFSCLTDNVGNLYGTAVPGTPPAGQATLGDPCGANLNEDWGLATSIVAGLKPWQADSVRVIVPISDEGPRCGNPVNDPGDDRDAVLYAIGQAQANNVIVSPISGDGSSGGVMAMMDLIAGATNGQAFASSDPGMDLADGIKGIVVDACDSRGDCNDNDVPDSCDLTAMTSQDCDMSGTPDECEADCNANGLHDSCDIANMTSADNNTNAVPDECEGIVLTGGADDWDWTPVSGALGYDLARGDAVTLVGGAGDYSVSTLECVVNDHAGTTWPLGADPASGEVFWYLVRGVLGSGPLTYDAFGSGLQAGRDAGIGASGMDCP